MVLNGNRLGEILLEANVLTKRQLNKALAMQTAGDDRKLGEILVELKYITIEDLTGIMMSNGHSIEEQVPQKSGSIELSEEKVLSTKFTLSLQTMITAAVGLSSLIGMWYALQAEIKLAKELPRIDNIYANEYPSKIDAHNWPSSMEQYEVQVGGLTEDMEAVYELLEEYEKKIDRLEDKVQELRIKIASIEGG
jgi:hypothetical protein